MNRPAPLALLATLVLGALPARSLAAQACSGCTPLTDLGPGLYLGQYEGGLYAGGANTPPPAHRADALSAAAEVLPRDAAGAVDPDGWIGFLSITMSNANQEFSAYERRVDQDALRNARVAVVNGAEGGQALDVIANPAAPYWTHLDQRLLAAGLSAPQVQVVWLKIANASVPDTSFPNHATSSMASATTVLQHLKASFPNLKLAFLSSRTYGGYTNNSQRGEPLSYETGFATKWLIESQIAGAPDLNHDASQGPVVAPLLLWGPYLWTNGTLPRGDGLVWLPGDVEGDGIHPTESGEQKVADMLSAFFATEASSFAWFGAPLGARLESVEAVADATTNASQPTTNFGGDALLAAGGSRLSYLKFDLSGVSGNILRAKLSLRLPAENANGGGATVLGLSDTSWDELTITAANAPPIDGAQLGLLPTLSRGTATSVDVSGVAQAASGGLLSLAISTNHGAGSPVMRYLSRESGVAPRLVLSVLPPCAEPAIPYCRALPNSSGLPAELSVIGSASLAASDMALAATSLPSTQFGLFFYGFGAAQFPFGEGRRCVAAPTQRLSPPGLSNPGGELVRALDFGSAPLGAGPMAVAPGDLLHFQCWYRDPTGGPSGFNLSRAVQVLACP